MFFTHTLIFRRPIYVPPLPHFRARLPSPRSAFVSSRSPSAAALLQSVSSAAADMDDSTDAFTSIEAALAGCEALDDLPMAVGLGGSHSHYGSDEGRGDYDGSGGIEGQRRPLPDTSADGSSHALLSPTSSAASLWRASRVSTMFAAPPLRHVGQMRGNDSTSESEYPDHDGIFTTHINILFRVEK